MAKAWWLGLAAGLCCLAHTAAEDEKPEGACFFLCDDGFTCLPAAEVCDQFSDCPQTEWTAGGEDESDLECSGEAAVEENEWRCTEDWGRPISIDSRCNGTRECTDQSDEKGCLVTVSLTVRNALDNQPLGGVKVSYSLGEETGDVTTDFTGRTDFPLAHNQLPGRVNISASRDGFLPEQVTVAVGPAGAAGQRAEQLGLSLNPRPAAASQEGIRIVMNWGARPKDLDLHTIQVDPRTFRQCQTYWHNKTDCPGLHLDVDNRAGGSNGAETITLEKAGTANYLIYVHDYSYCSPGSARQRTGKCGAAATRRLDQSGARLALYGAAGRVERVEVPTKDHPHKRSMYWLVGWLEGPRGLASFHRINQLLDHQPRWKPEWAQDLGGTFTTTG